MEGFFRLSLSKLIALALIVLTFSTAHSCGGRRGVTGVKMELPAVEVGDTLRLVQYEAFTLLYNLSRKTPDWVAWELTAAETEGEQPRASKFTVDYSLDFTQGDNDDYRNSGWDRGHMAPSADMKWSGTAMKECFYYTNACPQNHNLNNGVWKSLEETCRSLAKYYGKVWIATGPIYTDYAYGHIGPHRVAVPDAFYKVLLILHEGEYYGIGFICANKAGKKKLPEYSVTIDSVEAVTGLDFFCNLTPEQAERAEGAVQLEMWF